MKRIIQCQKCTAKLSVFDIGKPISQKCPKCGAMINLPSEKALPTPNKNTQEPTPAPSPDTTKKPTQPLSSLPEAESAAPTPKNTESALPATAPVSDKQPVKPESALDEQPIQPAPLPDAEPTGLQPVQGSLFFKAFAAGALLIIIIMLLMLKLSLDKRYQNLIQHLQYIEKNMAR